jgi:hypothetical protein
MSVRIEGGSREQRAILYEILAGLPGTEMRVLRVAPEYDLEPEPDEHNNPPPDWDPTTPLGDALRLVDPARPDGRTEWELELLGAAFSYASARAGLTPVIGVFSQNGGIALTEGDLRRPDARLDREAEDARIRDAAAEAGAEVDSIEFLEVGGGAVAVTLRVTEPHGFLRRGLRTFIELSGHREASRTGSYFEVRDDQPRPVYQAGRGVSGMSGHRRDVACCAPSGISRGLLAPDRPSCPVFG